MRGDKAADPRRGRHEGPRGSVSDNVEVLVEKGKFGVVHVAKRNVSANEGDEPGVSNFGLLQVAMKRMSFV